jgi:DNA-binding CsgD family transcriptional regulator
MTEPEHFASRPWTQAEDDMLRCLALKGLSSTAIGIRMNRTEAVVRSHARQMQIILRRNGPRQLQMG